MATHREVPLSGGWKLVLARSERQVYLRLRALQGEEWGFLTPPLPLTSAQLGALSIEGDDGAGHPVALEHERMDGKLNLLAYRGQVHVHFGGGQRSGTVRALREALDVLGEG